MSDYISREAVLKAFKLIAENPNKDYQRGMQDTIDCLVPEVIAYIPTADVQPVKRGKWRQVSVQNDEFNNHLYECTLCRATDRHNINVNVPYCWHCGARMDGDTND